MATKNFSLENVSPLEPNSLWLDDGILYINFNQPFSVQAAQATNDQGDALRKEAGLEHLPAIIIFTNKGKTIDLSLSDITKASMSGKIEAVNTVIVVGLEGASLQIAQLANKVAFHSKLIFCKTLEEAREAAQPFKGSTSTVLE